MPTIALDPKLIEDPAAGLSAVPFTPSDTARRNLILEIGPSTSNDFTGPLALRIICLDPELRAAFPDPEVPLALTKLTLAPLVESCQDLWWEEIFGSRLLRRRRFQDVSEKPVSESVYRQDILPKLARKGFELFVQIFRPGGPEYESTRNVGAGLRGLMRRQGLSITIRSREFFVPWNLLYLGGPDEADETRFWGYQHCIEHDISRRVSISSPFATQPMVAVHLDENIDLDKRFKDFRCNARFLALLKDHTISPAPRNNLLDFKKGLMNGASEHIFYFCCHARAAESAVDKATGIVKAISPELFLTSPPREPVRPVDIDAWLDSCESLPGSPLVFINACEAARTGSYLYDGFASRFLNHAARCVIGPELEMPAIFARDFAIRFFEDFFKTGPEHSVAKIMLRLRREYLTEHFNPLGLLYSLYRGGGLYIASRLPAGKAAKSSDATVQPSPSASVD